MCRRTAGGWPLSTWHPTDRRGFRLPASLERPEQPARRISHEPAIEPLFSSRGDELFYRTDTHLVSLPLDLGETVSPGDAQALFRDIYDRSRLGGMQRNYSVFPDGNRFVFPKVDDETRSRVICVQNWPALAQGPR